MVMFKLKQGVPVKQGKEAMEALGEYVKTQPGFVSRKVSLSKEDEFLDLVYWTDLDSAHLAAEKVMKDETLSKHFSVIDQETMQFKHFELINQV